METSLSCSDCGKYFKHKRSLKRHSLKHSLKSYLCENCTKSFYRVDRLTRHMKKCKPTKILQCYRCEKTFSKKSNLKRHVSNCKGKKITPEKCNYLVELTLAYKRDIDYGFQLSQCLQSDSNIIEEALPDYERECLKKYHTSCGNNVDLDKIVLKKWQDKVLQFIDHPCDRSCFWVVGCKGNEGKTFLQKYIRQLFGTRRVVQMELGSKKSDLAYLLSKECLTCKDIFLFNLLRSDTCEAAYGLIENIKDGLLMSAKYKTKRLKIKTPNTVIVFSNFLPDKAMLSTDRWKIYSIVNDILEKR